MGDRLAWLPSRCDRHKKLSGALDLSKIEAGKLELNAQTVQLSPLINDVISTAGQLAEQNKNRPLLSHGRLPLISVSMAGSEIEARAPGAPDACPFRLTKLRHRMRERIQHRLQIEG